MGLEQVTEILLDQALPWLTPPQDYVLLDALCDDGCGRFSRSRYRYLAGFWRSDNRTFGWFSDHISPISTIAPGRPGSQQHNKQATVFNLEDKTDDRIVNNIECGYHQKNADAARTRGTQYRGRKRGKWHEES